MQKSMCHYYYYYYKKMPMHVNNANFTEYIA